MADLLFSRALLPHGWARNVHVRTDGAGALASVQPDAGPIDGARVVDGVAVPGVPDVHSHAFQRALAGLTEVGSADGDTFWSWRERMYAFLERLTPDHVEAVAAQLQVELLRHGYTALTEFHYLRNAPGGRPYADPTEMARRILEAAGETGIGLTLLPTLYRTSDFGGAPPRPEQARFVAGVDEILEDVALLTAAVAGHPDRAVGLALHSLRAVPPEAMASAVDGAPPGTPIHIHVAEQVREVEACVSWSGARPVRWLLDHAPVDGRWCAVHATHMDPDEIRDLAASGAVAGLCPTTEANLGDGVFPLAAWMGAGGTFAVGTDSHVSVSPAADLRTLEYGQRLVHRVRNVGAGRAVRSTARRLLEAVWAGGAAASGRPLGRLAAGARADVVVLDPEHPALAGRADDALLDSWVFSGEDTPVRDVMVGGRWVIENGRHPRQEEILEAYRAAARSLV